MGSTYQIQHCPPHKDLSIKPVVQVAESLGDTRGLSIMHMWRGLGKSGTGNYRPLAIAGVVDFTKTCSFDKEVKTTFLHQLERGMRVANASKNIF